MDLIGVYYFLHATYTTSCYIWPSSTSRDHTTFAAQATIYIGRIDDCPLSQLARRKSVLGIDAGRLGRTPLVSAALLGFARLAGLLAYQSSGVMESSGGDRRTGNIPHICVAGCDWWEPSSWLADSFNKCCCHIDWGMRRVASGVGLFCEDSPLSCILLASCSGLLICLIPHFLPGIPASLLRSSLPTFPLTRPALAKLADLLAFPLPVCVVGSQ